jgi:hypothetical protein
MYMGLLEHGLPSTQFDELDEYDEHGPARNFDFSVSHPSTLAKEKLPRIPLRSSYLEYTRHLIRKTRNRPPLESDGRWMIFEDWDELEDFPEGGVLFAGVRITCSLRSWVKLMGLQGRP